jgi:tetratricopeptide (TPR) repeat protein
MEGRFSFILIFIFFLCVCISPGWLRGQDLPEEDGSESAKDYFKRGVILYEAGDYKGALDNFLKSYKMKSHYKIRFNIGLCYYRLGRNAAAANELELYLLEQGDDIDKAVSEEILETLEKLQEKIGILYINIDAEDAKVLVDKVEYGTSPLNRAIYVEPGVHHIEVKAQDSSHWDGTVDTAPGEKFQINVVMKGVKKKAEVEKVEAAADQDYPVKPEYKEKASEKRKSISRGYFYAALGLTIASAVVGAAAGGMALKKSRELDDLDRDCRELGWNAGESLEYDNYLSKREDLYSDANTFADVSTSFLVITGAMAAASILLLVFSKPREQVKEENTLVSFKPSGGFALGINF